MFSFVFQRLGFPPAARVSSALRRRRWRRATRTRPAPEERRALGTGPGRTPPNQNLDRQPHIFILGRDPDPTRRVPASRLFGREQPPFESRRAVRSTTTTTGVCCLCFKKGHRMIKDIKYKSPIKKMLKTYNASQV